jgi:hypothetical protein
MVKTGALLVALVTLPGAALAQPASQPTAAEVKAVEEEGLSPSVVQKLSARQLHDILRHKERARTKIEGGAEPIVVPISFFLCLVLVVGGTLYFRGRKDTQRHETIRLMVDKGVEVPRELLVTSKRRASDLKRGILLLSTGAGLAAFLAIVGKEQPAWSLGLVPAFIGAGYMLTWWIQSRRAKDRALEDNDL